MEECSDMTQLHYVMGRDDFDSDNLSNVSSEDAPLAANPETFLLSFLVRFDSKHSFWAVGYRNLFSRVVLVLELKYLNLLFIPEPFLDQSHQLRTLNHIGIDSTGIDGNEYDFAFLLPHHLPSLSSIALTEISLENSSSFREHFHLCSTQIRYLFVENRMDPQDIAAVVACCSNPMHLCVVFVHDNLSTVVNGTRTTLLSFTTSADVIPIVGPVQSPISSLQDSRPTTGTHLYLIPSEGNTKDQNWEVERSDEDNRFDWTLLLVVWREATNCSVI